MVAHVSCQPKLAVAERSSFSFGDPTLEVETLRIIGDESFPENKFHFDAGRRLLIVPANDAYEGLPTKVIKAFLFMGLSCITVPILKLDDDVTEMVSQNAKCWRCVATSDVNANFPGGQAELTFRPSLSRAQPV